MINDILGKRARWVSVTQSGNIFFCVWDFGTFDGENLVAITAEIAMGSFDFQYKLIQSHAAIGTLYDGEQVVRYGKHSIRVMSINRFVLQKALNSISAHWKWVW